MSIPSYNDLDSFESSQNIQYQFLYGFVPWTLATFLSNTVGYSLIKCCCKKKVDNSEISSNENVSVDKKDELNLDQNIDVVVGK